MFSKTHNPLEAKSIRESLKLRHIISDNSYEVYTTIHGSGIFKWFRITKETAEWYSKQFSLQIEEYHMKVHVS